MRSHFIHPIAFGICVASACVPAQLHAQTYPIKTVRLIVPFAAGGGTDIMARLVAQKLTEGLGQTFVVDNRAGANGIIGSELVAKSAPDGYTVLIGTNSTHAANQSLYKKLPYDFVKDFAPVSGIAQGSLLHVVNADLPVKSMASSARWVKCCRRFERSRPTNSQSE